MKKKRKSLTPAQRQAILESLKQSDSLPIRSQIQDTAPVSDKVPAENIETTALELKKIGLVLAAVIVLLGIAKIIELKTPYLNDFSEFITLKLGL